MGRKGGVKEKFSFCRFRLKKVKKVGFLRMAATPQDCQDIFRKDASLANPLTSDARSVMLRIPLPEDDGSALALLEDNQALQMRPWQSHRE